MNIFLLVIFTLPVPEPYTWEELHTNAHDNPEYFVKLVKDYYYNFPCDDCREHFQKTVDELETFLPIDKITTTKEAQVWGWLMHNNVNLRLGKDWLGIDCIHLVKNRHRKHSNTLKT